MPGLNHALNSYAATTAALRNIALIGLAVVIVAAILIIRKKKK